MAKFTALASTFDGVRKLLAGDIEVLGGSALMSRVEYVQPGEKITRSFDRMEGANISPSPRATPTATRRAAPICAVSDRRNGDKG